MRGPVCAAHLQRRRRRARRRGGGGCRRRAAVGRKQLAGAERAGVAGATVAEAARVL